MTEQERKDLHNAEWNNNNNGVRFFEGVFWATLGSIMIFAVIGGVILLAGYVNAEAAEPTPVKVLTIEQHQAGITADQAKIKQFQNAIKILENDIQQHIGAQKTLRSIAAAEPEKKVKKKKSKKAKKKEGKAGE